MDSNEYNNNSDEGFGAVAWLVGAFVLAVVVGVILVGGNL